MMPPLTPEESPAELGCIASTALELVGTVALIVALDDVLEEVLESGAADEVVLVDASVGSVMLK